MRWVVDTHLERTRRTSVDLVATASTSVGLVREKCAILRDQSHALLQGSISGDAMVRDFEIASDLLAEAGDRLARAINAIHGINVMVEVADYDEEDQ